LAFQGENSDGVTPSQLAKWQSGKWQMAFTVFGNGHVYSANK